MLKQIVFNIECYGELFSGMAPYLTLYIGRTLRTKTEL